MRPNVEIVEFSGEVDGADDNPIVTYLLAIDGKYKTKYSSPHYEYLPSVWRHKYQIASYKVGRFSSWKKFYSACNELLKEKEPFSRHSRTKDGGVSEVSGPTNESRPDTNIETLADELV